MYGEGFAHKGGSVLNEIDKVYKRVSRDLDSSFSKSDKKLKKVRSEIKKYIEGLDEFERIRTNENYKAIPNDPVINVFPIYFKSRLYNIDFSIELSTDSWLLENDPVTVETEDGETIRIIPLERSLADKVTIVSQAIIGSEVINDRIARHSFDIFRILNIKPNIDIDKVADIEIDKIKGLGHTFSIPLKEALKNKEGKSLEDSVKITKKGNYSSYSKVTHQITEASKLLEVTKNGKPYNIEKKDVQKSLDYVVKVFNKCIERQDVMKNNLEREFEK